MRDDVLVSSVASSPIGWVHAEMQLFLLLVCCGLVTKFGIINFSYRCSFCTWLFSFQLFSNELMPSGNHPLPEAMLSCWPSSVLPYGIIRPQWVKLWCFLNPLRAKFFRVNINMYLHFMTFLRTYKTQVVEIPARVRQGPAYTTKSISWLLMSWRRKEPGHQQPWYWPS